MSVASALSSPRPQSWLSPDIFNRMHLLFTQVHFLFDRSAGSEVNMLHNISPKMSQKGAQLAEK